MPAGYTPVQRTWAALISRADDELDNNTNREITAQIMRELVMDFMFTTQQLGSISMQDTDGDTSIAVELTDDDDTIRFTTAGTSTGSMELVAGADPNVDPVIHPLVRLGDTLTSANGTVLIVNDSSELVSINKDFYLSASSYTDTPTESATTALTVLSTGQVVLRNISGSGGATALNGLSDVDTTVKTLQNGDVISYNSVTSNWEASPSVNIYGTIPQVGDQTLLTTGGNWDANNIYTGGALSGTYDAGIKWFQGTYLYEYDGTNWHRQSKTGAAGGGVNPLIQDTDTDTYVSAEITPDVDAIRIVAESLPVASFEVQSNTGPRVYLGDYETENNGSFIEINDLSGYTRIISSSIGSSPTLVVGEVQSFVSSGSSTGGVFINGGGLYTLAGNLATNFPVETAATEALYFNSSGRLVRGAISAGSRIQDADNDTYIDVEPSADSDEINLNAGGLEIGYYRATGGSVNVALGDFASNNNGAYIQVDDNAQQVKLFGGSSSARAYIGDISPLVGTPTTQGLYLFQGGLYMELANLATNFPVEGSTSEALYINASGRVVRGSISGGGGTPTRLQDTDNDTFIDVSEPAANLDEIVMTIASNLIFYADQNNAITIGDVEGNNNETTLLINDTDGLVEIQSAGLGGGVTIGYLENIVTSGTSSDIGIHVDGGIYSNNFATTFPVEGTTGQALYFNANGRLVRGAISGGGSARQFVSNANSNVDVSVGGTVIATYASPETSNTTITLGTVADGGEFWLYYQNATPPTWAGTGLTFQEYGPHDDAGINIYYGFVSGSNVQIWNLSAQNQLTPISPPVLSSVEINASGDLILTLDSVSTVNANVLPQITLNGPGSPYTLSGVSGSGSNTLTVTIDENPIQGGAYSLTYVVPSNLANGIRKQSDNASLQAITGFAITNNYAPGFDLSSLSSEALFLPIVGGTERIINTGGVVETWTNQTTGTGYEDLVDTFNTDPAYSTGPNSNPIVTFGGSDTLDDGNAAQMLSWGSNDPNNGHGFIVFNVTAKESAGLVRLGATSSSEVIEIAYLSTANPDEMRVQVTVNGTTLTAGEFLAGTWNVFGFNLAGGNLTTSLNGTAGNTASSVTLIDTTTGLRIGRGFLNGPMTGSIGTVILGNTDQSSNFNAIMDQLKTDFSIS